MDERDTGLHRIDVHIEGALDVEETVLQQTARAVLDHQQAFSVEVAIVLSDDKTLQELNRRFRNVDAPTDVLAFPNETRGPFSGAGEQPPYLGDIIISYARAREQASQAGHEVLAELQLLVVHGMLHLLGFDDQEELQRAEMWSTQEAVLEILDVRVTLPD